MPPTAKIQLPVRVRSRIQEASAANTSHHRTVILMFMKPSGMSAAKMALAEANPSSSEMLSEATVPVMPLVTARLMPRSAKNVARVIRKLGMPVRTTR